MNRVPNKFSICAGSSPISSPSAFYPAELGLELETIFSRALYVDCCQELTATGRKKVQGRQEERRALFASRHRTEWQALWSFPQGSEHLYRSPGMDCGCEFQIIIPSQGDEQCRVVHHHQGIWQSWNHLQHLTFYWREEKEFLMLTHPSTFQYLYN